MFRLSIITITVLLLAVSAQADETETVAFKFAPDVPVSYVEESITHRTTIALGVDPEPETATLRTRFTVEKDGEGFVVHRKPESFSLKQGGKEISDPMIEVVQTTPLTYRLDSDGKLIKIEGVEGVLEKVKKDAPRNMVRMLEQILNEDKLRDNERSQWESRVGDFIGKSGVRNTGWLNENSSPLPDGTTAVYYVVTIFDGMTEVDGKQLARLKFLYTADRNRLQQQANDLVRDIVRNLPRPRPLPAMPGFDIWGSGERLVDPDTMIIYSEKASRNIQMQLEPNQDSSVPVIIQEQKEIRLTTPPRRSVSATENAD